MFKKLKDKLAEEVKSSPQRIQQFAQAAQAAVTSASSSISDITNNDLFSIGDNDRQTSQDGKEQLLSSSVEPKVLKDVNLVEKGTMSSNSELGDFVPPNMNERQRRLSNSSFASDISFRLPSFESSSMYHLQSDMEVSASEAEERGLSGSAVSLDRVSKEQLYAAYRRTRERYAKYRTQYADLARHYKLLERENAKAKSVLVETQDKALRRISELKEQSVLEQSAKVHLEKSLRIEMNERDKKIESLNSKIFVMLNKQPSCESFENNDDKVSTEPEKPLIELSPDLQFVPKKNETINSEISNLNNKVEKLEQLVNKYKESLKSTKEKNSQMTSEIQLLSSELEIQKKETEHFKDMAAKISESEKKVQELNDINEQLQNKVNSFDFNKTKELSALEIDLRSAQEEINHLQSKISVSTKREEEYAISLAENKLSIHKELESKESEIKSLKDNLSACNNEIQSLNIILMDYKKSTLVLEEEKSKLNNEVKELYSMKTKMKEIELQMLDATQKYNSLEQSKAKFEEDYRCLQLQFKQETAEKLAMIDRNAYLEVRNSQLMDENTKKTLQLNELFKEVETLKSEALTNETNKQEFNLELITKESDLWKSKYENLELEIQEERVELVKLQSEIEKLLENHERIQRENVELNAILVESKDQCLKLKGNNVDKPYFNTKCNELLGIISEFKKVISVLSDDAKSLKMFYEQKLGQMNNDFMDIFNNCVTSDEYVAIRDQYEKVLREKLELKTKLKTTEEENATLIRNIGSLNDEIEDLRPKLDHLRSNNVEKTRSTTNLSAKYEDCLYQLNSVNTDMEILAHERKQLEIANENLQKRLKLSQNESRNTVDELEKYNNNLSSEINELKGSNLSLNIKLNDFTNEHKNQTEMIKKLTEINKELVTKSIDYEKKMAYIVELEDNIKIMSDNNLSLKSKSEKIGTNVKQLQNEIEEIRRSHTELEMEKDRLNVEIEKLESNQCDHKNVVKIDRNNQTELLPELKSSNEDIESKKSQENTNIISESLELLKNENEVLQDENKRLQSDIEGLQSYLTKVSKENSMLNDKLREVLASSETTPDKGEDLADLQNEIQTNKEKIEDLLRENTLLVEENLELKDQLQLQNSPVSSDNSKTGTIESLDFLNLETKYKTLLNVKSNLEGRVNDLDEENRSATMNINQLQANNEKLRLTNEKLERRLDEALVSLRHLHSLQDNSELEYLRNILFEYLTGSGMHSLTLAKVLAAVVKFNDAQTNAVLQKEKERQGLLRQLGLL